MMLPNYINKWDTNNDAIFIQAIKTTIRNNLSTIDLNTKLAQRKPIKKTLISGND